MLVFVLSIVYLLLFRRYLTADQDEGVILQGAERILHGQVLYRDFFSFFTPGSYYWQALLLRAFGDSILVPRTALVVYGAIFSILLYFLSRRVCSRQVALFVVYLSLLTALPYQFMVLHNWDSTLCAFLTLYLAVRFVESGRGVYACVTGLLAAATCLFEQSKGGGLLLGLSVGLSPAFLSAGRVRLGRVRHLVELTAGFGVPFAATFAYFALHRGLREMLAAWAWPLLHYGTPNRVSYGYLPLADFQWQMLHSGSWGWRAFLLFILSPTLLVPVLPLLALGTLIWWGARIVRHGCLQPADEYYFLVSAVLSGLLLSIVVTNRGLPHIMYLAPMFYLVLAWVLEGWDTRSSMVSALRPLVMLYFFLSFTAFGLTLLWSPLGAKHRLPTRRGVLETTYPEKLVPFIQDHVTPGSRIFAYPYQPLFYYLTATFSPTRYEYLYPGMNPRQDFEEALQQLQADDTAVVVLMPSFGELMGADWPSTPIGVIGAKDPVVEYVNHRYHFCKGFKSLGNCCYLYMVRMGLRCPAEGGASRE